ncbi:transcriptional repressor [Olsenella sp. HMSC062G07]|uniref:Fur family transcriptional regulator n=1 Tax=Olsenella sp. HMSC062G07 TaxID=1739330 RepID=UPI0008A3632B|nr:transcriptional repressor [Olsenella sp. HMSC062G07]OFK22299.1 hypothetical protein HMPREF2826_02005 [Olsenella sp. HMSC062G07]
MPTELRYSRQRAAIWEWIRDRRDHPTADEVYVALREQFPHLSLATVYRNLMVLSDQGKLRPVVAGDKVTRFDPNTAEHQHFRCTRCGRVLDVEAPEVGRAVRRLDLGTVGTLTDFSLCLEGVCTACAQVLEARGEALAPGM